MSDLVVDTVALRSAASSLSRVARVASDLHERGGRLPGAAEAAGDPVARRSLEEFLHAWSYGMGILAEDAGTLAALLSTAAAAFEAVEADLVAASGGMPSDVNPAMEMPAAPVSPVALVSVEPSRSRGPALQGFADVSSAAGLVPGDPGDLGMLAVTLRSFGVETSRSASALDQISLGGWTGRAADVFAGELEDAPKQLLVASQAFDGAARALRAYSIELSGAQDAARVAWGVWQDGRRQSQAWKAAGSPGGLDPGLEAVDRAEATLTSARSELALAARALAGALDAARERAPHRPGRLARLASGVTSFAKGVGEGFVGMAQGAAQFAELGFHLSPAGMALDPQGYLKAVDQVTAMVEVAIADPGGTLATMLDLETWRTDPARALGHLAPDLLLALASAGAGVAAAKSVGGGARWGKMRPGSEGAVGDLLSGARIRPRDLLDMHAQNAWARAAYDSFLVDDRDLDAMAVYLADVPRAAGGSGFSREELALVKNHLMREEHPLEDYETGQLVMRRFDPDADIADAWVRLRSGSGLPQDHVLLEHELAEARLMSQNSSWGYRQAHLIANEKFNWESQVPMVRQDLDGSW